MKVVTVVGARPQFIKAAAVSRVLRAADGLTEILVHTGQHFDSDMSDVFFEQMDIPLPDHQLGVSGLSHGAMTGRMLEGLEVIFQEHQPDWVLVYGDTNSTLAGALAATKLHIPIAHVEAGLRSNNMQMPEEINRIITDRISSVLFCPTDQAVRNLEGEGYDHAKVDILKVGDVMQDAANYYMNKSQPPVHASALPEDGFVLATIHRAENTDDPARLSEIVRALNHVHKETPVIMPLHPRTRQRLDGLDVKLDVLVIDPVGYLEMIWLLQHAGSVMTDSGGLQKEAFFFGNPCVTLRDETEWVELIELGVNQLAGADFSAITSAWQKMKNVTVLDDGQLYGEGDRFLEYSRISNCQTMRVIYLHQYFNTPEMPGGTRSFEMGKRLVEAGHDVEMITTWREPDERKGWIRSTEGGMNVHWQPIPYSNRMGFTARIFAFLKFAFGASRYAASQNADVVFATSTPLTVAIPGIYAAWRLRVPLVFEIRDVWPDVPIALGVLKNPLLIWLARRLEAFTYSYATRIVALAPGMKDSVVAKNIDPDRIDVIPNGADLTLFGDDQQIDIAKLLTKDDIPLDRKIILYAGTLGSVNNVDYIIDLAVGLQQRNRGQEFLFLIIGDGIELERLTQMAEGADVLDRSVFFLGSRSKREVADWYRCCTASLMTYNGPEIVFKDSVSNKFFDSLAAGKPVLANFSGFSTIVAEEAGAGIILPANPADGLDIFIEKLSDERWLLTAGANARALGESRFSRDMLAEQLLESLRNAVNSRPGYAGNNKK